MKKILKITWLMLALFVIFTYIKTEVKASNDVSQSQTTQILGDLNGDGKKDTNDVVYLLMHTYFKEIYPVTQECDYNGSSMVDTNDVVYLLMHTYFPEMYPLTGGSDIPVHVCSENQSEWININNTICGQVGLQQIICTKCRKVLQEKTSKIEHKYVINVIDEAVEGSLGTKRKECAYCRQLVKEFNYVDNAYHQNGKLSVNGRDLVNQYGEKYQLYGLSTHGIQWFSRVVNFDTICEIQENFGNNIIRFALYTDEDGYCSGSDAVKKQMLETLHRGIDIATELGLYVIVDWHMVGAENVLDKNPLTYLEEAKEFFSYISEYYKDQDNILYEIMNEPNGTTTWADCKKYANEVIPCIRKNTDAIVLVGNPKWTADLNSVMKDPLVGYENIMYTYHFYAADHSSTTQVVNAYDRGFPVFISEFGFMNSDGNGSVSETNGNKWKNVLDPRNISYVAWNISNSQGDASIFKHNTSNLSDVSDANLKPWGIYLKNWYRTKSLTPKENEEELKAEVELMTEIPEWSNSYECFIVSNGHDDSRLNYDWSSTDTSLLTISEYSTLTIKGNGKCSIIAKHKTSGLIGILDVELKDGKIVSYTSRYTE